MGRCYKCDCEIGKEKKYGLCMQCDRSYCIGCSEDSNRTCPNCGKDNNLVESTM